MDKYYKVQISYPNGKVEVIEEDFEKGADALEYGNSLLAQVHGTESVINRRANLDIFDERESIEPYFMIVEINGKKYRMVYDSRGR